MDLIKAIEAEQIKDDVEIFGIGDTIKVFFKIIEGTTERVQVFEGVCIAKNNSGLRKTFTVRKMSFGVGVEECSRSTHQEFRKSKLLNMVKYAALNSTILGTE